MRTWVEIGEPQIQALDALARHEKQSRAALIRTAIDDFLAKCPPAEEAVGFGSWGDRKRGGLKYQCDLRSEW